jgi:uncharacterized membrane protein
MLHNAYNPSGKKGDCLGASSNPGENAVPSAYLRNREIKNNGAQDSLKHAEISYALLLICAAAWCSAIILAPILASSSGFEGEAGKTLYLFFHRICHQFRARSFILNGMQMGVCSRCSAIYFGFLLGTLIYPAIRSIKKPEIPPRAFLFLAFIPMAVDALLGFFILYEPTLATRAISGGIAGLALSFFIVPAFIQAISELVTNRSFPLQQKGISNASETR